MMKISLICPNPVDATAYYRIAKPFAQLRKRKLVGRSDELSITYGAPANWAEMGMIDILVLQRPQTAYHVALAKQARANGVKIWVDYDDDLLSMDPDHILHDYYANVSVRKDIETCVEMADALTVSTKALWARYSKYNRNVYCVPNALPPELWENKRKDKDKPKLILWRGTRTHERDLRDATNEILEAAKLLPEHKFAFLGYDPYWITEKLGKQAIVLPPVDITGYFDALTALDPQVMIVPLSESRFNDAKSNIAFLEATICGAVTVAPLGMHEWDLNSIVKYNRRMEGSLAKSITWAVGSPESVTYAQHEVEKTFLLSPEPRLEVLRRLLETSA